MAAEEIACSDCPFQNLGPGVELVIGDEPRSLSVATHESVRNQSMLTRGIPLQREESNDWLRS